MMVKFESYPTLFYMFSSYAYIAKRKLFMYNSDIFSFPIPISMV